MRRIVITALTIMGRVAPPRMMKGRLAPDRSFTPTLSQRERARACFASFIVSVVIVGVVALPARAAETTLRITLQLPLKSHLGQNLTLFKNEVEKSSHGAIDVQIYDSAQLYRDKEVPQAVGSGQIEMGVASLTRFVGEIPAVDIFYLPFVFDTEKLVRAATKKGGPVRGPLDAAILKTGNRVLWWQADGSTVFLSKNGPIKTPADIKRKKVRVFGKTLGAWIKAAGGVPTLISGSEQFLAYQRRTVDIGMTGITGVVSRKLWEVMSWITLANGADIEFVVLINEKLWSSLPEDQKKIITEAAEKADMALRNDIAHIEESGLVQAESHGMKAYTPTEEEITLWKASAQPVINSYLKDSGALGRQLYNAALKLER